MKKVIYYLALIGFLGYLLAVVLNLLDNPQGELIGNISSLVLAVLLLLWMISGRRNTLEIVLSAFLICWLLGTVFTYYEWPADQALRIAGIVLGGVTAAIVLTKK